MSGDAHRFRFFVDAVGAVDATVALRASDTDHARVLRLEPGADVEIVDTDAQVWRGEFRSDGRVVLRAVAEDAATARRIELIAGALTGNRFDELVDGAVQAGAALVTPLVSNARDRDRLSQRRDRLQRLATSAAKQSKQVREAAILDPIGTDGLLELAPGIVLDAAATESVLDVELPMDGAVRVLIGPAEGLEPVLVSRLVDAGWTLARLGSSILRAELAAPVAVASIAMRIDAERSR